MTILFTHSSNNFLAQAITLMRSMVQHVPDAHKVFFLTDERSGDVDYEKLQPSEFIVVDDTIVPGFTQLASRYSITEFNSNLKPFLFEYLIKKYPAATGIIYFDADTVIYNPIDRVIKLLRESDIIVTPHFSTPIPDDGKEPFENIALNYGLFNMGFLAVNPQTLNSRTMLRWWGMRTREHGHNDVVHGYFVDQLWCNLLPIFFERVHILKDHGYNMAPWNLHERNIESIKPNDDIKLANGENLVFYHFSSYDFNKPGIISKKYNRNTLQNTGLLVQLYRDYQKRLLDNNIETLSAVACKLELKQPSRPGRMRRMLGPGARMVKRIWQRM